MNAVEILGLFLVAILVGGLAAIPTVMIIDAVEAHAEGEDHE
jgi:hypothetical protein